MSRAFCFVVSISLLLRASLAVYIVPESSPKQLTTLLTNVSFPRIRYIEPNGMTYYKSPDNNKTYIYHLFSTEWYDTYPPPSYTHSFAQSILFDSNFNPLNEKPFICRKCHKRFKYKHSLKIHLQTIHKFGGNETKKNKKEIRNI